MAQGVPMLNEVRAQMNFSDNVDYWVGRLTMAIERGKFREEVVKLLEKLSILVQIMFLNLIMLLIIQQKYSEIKHLQVLDHLLH